jgi:hypothetical protein
MVAGSFAEYAATVAGFAEEDGFEGEVGGEAEGEAAGEKKAVAGVEEDGVGDGFDYEPALAGEHGVALDAVVPGELDGDVVEYREAAGDVDLGFHEGEDLGEGVHALGCRERMNGRG